jgi:hypothetical protein
VSSHSGPADLRHDFGAVGHWANLSSAAVRGSLAALTSENNCPVKAA